MRSLAFRAVYWIVSTFFVLAAVPISFLPGRGPTVWWVRGYAKTMVFLMRAIVGIRLKVRGHENVPSGPVIIAAKHQSWGDGFAMMSTLPNLSFVTGDHLLKFPFLGTILRKIGAIVVNNCGGARERGRLVAEELNQAREDGRSILIYPEGHLSPVGTQHRYKKGVYHMYERYGCPVVPVATDLGLRWPGQSIWLNAGPAHLEFLPAIEPGLPKAEFMALLEERIETRSLDLVDEQRAAGTAPAGTPDRPTEPVVVTQ